MIDSHCHLYWPNLKEQEKEVIERAKIAGVKKFINIGTNPIDCHLAKKQAEKYEDVFFTVGFHPCDLMKHEKSHYNFEEMEKLTSNKKCVGIGECGFDFFHEPFDEKFQEEVFLSQIKLAKELSLPLVIHTRNAGEKALDFLENFDGKFVIHCFTENQKFADRVKKMGGWIGIGGIITYPKAQELREVVKSFPLEKILLETDAPFLAPQKNRGKVNESSFIGEVAEKIAEIKGISKEEVVKATTKNSKEFFGI